MMANFKLWWTGPLRSLGAHLKHKEPSWSARWATSTAWKLYSSGSCCPTVHLAARLTTAACSVGEGVLKEHMGSTLSRISMLAAV